MVVYILLFALCWTNSIVGTTDINNWFLENTLVFIFLFFLILSYKKYQFSDLSYLLICVYLCLHVYGSKYTYAENPFGYWLRDIFIRTGIFMIVLYILVLVSCWLTRCVKCF
jgi:putative membrane protein